MGSKIYCTMVSTDGRMHMYSARTFANKYPSNTQKSQSSIPFDRIKATDKWIEYSLDQVVINKMMLTASRDDRYTLLSALKVVERKLNWMYKHPNFELAVAIREFKRAKRLLNL